LADETMLDAKVCECCQTSVAMTDWGPIVLYRDRSNEEIRDISVLRRVKGKWSESRPIFSDQWKINACPVNGPAVSAMKQKVVAAWYTGADNASHVKVVFSSNSGQSFSEPIMVDDGNPVGRVEVLLLKDGSAMVCWLEKTPSGGEIRVRRVHPNGKREPSITVAPAGTARSTGFPQMVQSGKTLMFAWTGARVFTAELPLQ
ncbi:MAG TPA: exo-alpha-sialidase, partial [Blastocatellia bacterium]|nr:exo-alpha-sialidase [Blastocatellia bacterium]